MGQWVWPFKIPSSQTTHQMASKSKPPARTRLTCAHSCGHTIRTQGTNAQGNLTSDGLRLFEYDGQNRLAKVLVGQCADTWLLAIAD